MNADKPGMNAVEITDLQFSYKNSKQVIQIHSLKIPAGERVFLHGPSGSGKTTLLGLMGGVLTAQAGHVQILGQDLTAMTPHQRDLFRGDRVGFIFQMFNLIPYLSVAENILLPCQLSRHRLTRMAADPREAALKWATRLGLAKHFDHPVTNLSVGQQQRVAAIRALMGRPELVIADEPTSSLDADRREEFINLLFELCDEAKATLVFVSHDQSLKVNFTTHLSLKELNAAHITSEA